MPEINSRLKIKRINRWLRSEWWWLLVGNSGFKRHKESFWGPGNVLHLHLLGGFVYGHCKNSSSCIHLWFGCTFLYACYTSVLKAYNCYCYGTTPKNSDNNKLELYLEKKKEKINNRVGEKREGMEEGRYFIIVKNRSNNCQ